MPQPVEALLPTKTYDNYVHALQIKLDIAGKDTIRDTLINIKYYPNLSLIDVKIKPLEIEITELDSVKETKNVVEETTTLEKLGLMFAGFLVIAIIWIIIKRLI